MRHHKIKHQAPPDCGFVLNERIGKGSFAVVYKGEWGGDLLPQSGNERPPKQQVAIKVVQRSHLKREKRLMDIFEAEMGILKRMQHPHIVHLIDIVQTSTDYNLIMEYCSIGDLSTFIKKKNLLIKRHPSVGDVFERYPYDKGGLHPSLVKHFLAQLASSLAFLRKHDIVHRDVKPQNVLLKPGAATEDESRSLGYVGDWTLPVVKIADFGFARFLPSTSMAETLCGSPLYMAPEILNYERYNAKADLWSVGAVTYEMVTGKPPFPAANHLELIKKIDEGKDVISFPNDDAADLQKLIRSLLKRSPEARLNFEEFFELTAWTDSSSATELECSNVSDDSVKMQPDATSLLASGVDCNMSISAGRARYADYLRSRGSKDVAVESASPSPESSQSTGAVSGNSDTNVKQTRCSGDGSESDYVFVEKRSVEVNSLADDLQAPPRAPRRLTNPENKTRRRRLSSITYGASPTSALAQALLKSSARLFGANIDVSGGSNNSSSSESAHHGNPFLTALSPPRTGERQIVDDLEQLATIAKVVILYADVKFTQLELDDDDTSKVESETKVALGSSESSSIKAGDLYPISSPSSAMDPYYQLLLASEALALHLKALSILACAMDRASEWWNASQSNQDTPSSSDSITTLVQWIRDKFNVCVDRAGLERSFVNNIKKELSEESAAAISEVTAEKLLFERALEMAKAAAVQEIAAVSSPTGASAEASSNCEMNYGTAVWMLKALLVSEKSEHELSDDDRVMVDTLMSKIAQRLAAFRLKTKGLVNSPSPRWIQATGSPNSQSSHFSTKVAGRTGFSQFTPP